MKCFYHSADLDGKCSGAIVRAARPECVMIGIDYGQPFPWGLIEPGEKVYMVDFSLQPFDDMLRLNELADLVWIDHHKTAIDASRESGAHFAGIQRDGIGACALVWEYFYLGLRPYGVMLLAQFDVWDHSDANCLPFQYGMRIEDTEPGARVWSRILCDLPSMGEIIMQGEICRRYERAVSENFAQACAYETVFAGLRCIAMNRLRTNSLAFESMVDPERHDAMLAWGWKNGSWTVSLYAARDGVDVSDVAKRFGGGGHAKAAGFQCTSLPDGLLG